MALATMEPDTPSAPTATSLRDAWYIACTVCGLDPTEHPLDGLARPSALRWHWRCRDRGGSDHALLPAVVVRVSGARVDMAQE